MEADHEIEEVHRVDIELVAQVEPDGLGWEFLRGSEARGWAEAGGARRADRPWLAVYRRRTPALR